MNANHKLSEESAPRWNVWSLFGGGEKTTPVQIQTTTVAANKPAAPANARRILVVDDDEVVRRSTELKLVAHGFAVSTAADGPSAIHAARSERPDLILLDLNFPPDVSLTWDGFGILSWLRRMETTRNIPVIIVTGEQTNNLPQRAQAAGAAGCFHKPLDFRPLLALIELRLKAAAAASLKPVAVQFKD